MKNIDKPISITITAGSIIKAIVLSLLLYFAFVLKDLLLVILTSVVIASAIEPGAKFFIRKRFPRVISVLIIYVSVIALFAIILYFFLPPLIGDFTQFISTLPRYIESLSVGTNQIQGIPAVRDLLINISNSFQDNGIVSTIGSGLSGATFGFLTTASAIFGGVVSFILIIVLSFYLSVQENGVANFLRIIIPIKHENYILDLWRRSEKKIGLWMQGQLVLGVIVGVLTYLGLSVLGVENALLLAFVAMVFELIPVFGPILASVPAVIFGFVNGGLTLGFLVIGLYVIIQQFESQLIHPLVVKKIVGIPAIIAIVALVVGFEIAGFLGLLLGVPLAAVLMEYLDDLEKKKAVQSREMSE